MAGVGSSQMAAPPVPHSQTHVMACFAVPLCAGAQAAGAHAHPMGCPAPHYPGNTDRLSDLVGLLQPDWAACTAAACGAPCGSCRRASKRSSCSGPAGAKSRSPAVRRRAEVNAWPESLRSAVRRSVPFATAALAGADVYHSSSLLPQPACNVHVAPRALCEAVCQGRYRPAWHSHAPYRSNHRSVLRRSPIYPFNESENVNALMCFRSEHRPSRSVEGLARSSAHQASHTASRCPA